ncbi:FxsA family protein [Marinimicrococcus flavescens]|uniref:FxsA family protein n=1 Tax=Marinimicrococcus flavescens TaxID=3031815 RepID=A0AAP3UYM0_9PROT|nr:FxsA family protein [Marinimicrococcus flavescens]
MRIPLILRAAVPLLPILEIVLLIVLGSELGALPVIGLLLASAVLGALLLRHHGARLVREIERNLNAGRLPLAETFRAACVGAAGVLLILPGVISDAVALVLVLPPLQRLLYNLLARGLGVDGGSGRAAARDGIIEADYEIVEERREEVIEDRRDEPGRGER